MPLDPRQYIRMSSDAFVRVTDADGTLLGCIPNSFADGVEVVYDQDRRAHDMMFGLIAAVIVNLRDGEDPRRLYDFVPVDDLDAVLRRQLVPQAPIAGSDPDIGRA